jgi:hypothetical protein
MHKTNDIPLDTIRLWIEVTQRVVIANVANGRHFVLVTAVEDDGDTLRVNNPSTTVHNDTYYSYSRDVVGWRLFDMKDCSDNGKRHQPAPVFLLRPGATPGPSMARDGRGKGQGPQVQMVRQLL